MPEPFRHSVRMRGVRRPSQACDQTSCGETRANPATRRNSGKPTRAMQIMPPNRKDAIRSASGPCQRESITPIVTASGSASPGNRTLDINDRPIPTEG
jgi:hypothetical protein